MKNGSFNTCDDKVRGESECPAPPPPPAIPRLQNWMESAMEHIGDKTLTQLSVPGAHDTLTFDLSHEVSEVDECNKYGIIAKIPSWVVPKDLTRGLAEAQQLNLKEQLDSGIRFMDFRAIVHDGVWKGVHCVVTYAPLEKYLGDLADWMHAHPKEVVVIQLSSHGSSNEDWPVSAGHLRELYSMLKNKLGPLLANMGENPITTTPLKTFVEKGQRVVMLVQKADQLQGSETYFLDLKQLDHGYDEKGVTDPKHWLKDYWSARLSGNNKGSDRFTDMTAFTSMPYTDKDFFMASASAPCTQYFSYLPEWCPRLLADIATLSNYYASREIEKAFANSGDQQTISLPNSPMFDMVDHDGTVRTGHDMIANARGTRDGPDEQRFARYAAQVVIILSNLPQDASGPLVDMLKAQHDKYKLQGWSFPKYGRCPLGQVPISGGQCEACEAC
jgi:hypothetical protein